MVFYHYIQRLKQEDYDKVPKTIDEKKDESGEKNNLDSSQFIR